MNFEDVKKGKIKSACGTTVNHSANVNHDELKNVLYIKKLHKSMNECLEGLQIMISKLLETIKMPLKL